MAYLSPYYHFRLILALFIYTDITFLPCNLVHLGYACMCRDHCFRRAVRHDGEKSLSRVWLFATPWTGPTRLLHPWNFPGKNTGVGCHFLFQEIFPTQGLNPALPHGRLYRFTVWATREVSRRDGKVRLAIHFSAPAITMSPSGLNQGSSGEPLESRPVASPQWFHVTLDYPIIYTVLQLLSGLDFPTSRRVLRRQTLCISWPSFISGVCLEQSLKWLCNEGQNKWMSRWMNTCSVAQSCPALCDPTDCSTPGFPSFSISRSLLKLMSIESVMPSKHPLSSPSPPAFNLSQHEGLFQWVGSLHQVVKVIRASASASVLSIWKCRIADLSNLKVIDSSVVIVIWQESIITFHWQNKIISFIISIKLWEEKVPFCGKTY